MFCGLFFLYFIFAIFEFFACNGVLSGRSVAKTEAKRRHVVKNIYMQEILWQN